MEALLSIFHIGDVGVGIMGRGRRRYLAYMGVYVGSQCAGGRRQSTKKNRKKTMD